MRILGHIAICSLFVSLLCTVACTVETEEVTPPRSSKLITGTTYLDGSGHLEIIDGQDVELAAGAQGGFHVWLSIRVEGAKGQLFLDREARRTSDQKLILRGQKQLIEIPEGESWYQIPDPIPALMCPSPIGIQVFDEEITFRVSLSNEEEETIATDTITLVPRCPTEEHREFCQSICKG